MTYILSTVTNFKIIIYICKEKYFSFWILYFIILVNVGQIFTFFLINISNILSLYKFLLSIKTTLIFYKHLFNHLSVTMVTSIFASQGLRFLPICYFLTWCYNVSDDILYYKCRMCYMWCSIYKETVISFQITLCCSSTC